MGGGLGFLNKKPWHPGSLRNVERVVKRESLASKEEKKKAQRLMERKNEKEQEDYWYQIHTRETDYSKQNMKTESTNIISDLPNNLTSVPPNHSRVFEEVEPPSKTIVNLKESLIPENELWRRMINDPMLVILRQEQLRIKEINENPALMSQLKNKTLQSYIDIKKNKIKSFEKDNARKKNSVNKKDITFTSIISSSYSYKNRNIYFKNLDHYIKKDYKNYDSFFMSDKRNSENKEKISKSLFITFSSYKSLNKNRNEIFRCGNMWDQKLNKMISDSKCYEEKKIKRYNITKKYNQELEKKKNELKFRTCLNKIIN